MKKLYLNRRGNTVLAKNLLDCIENCWREVSEKALFLKEYLSDSSETESAKNSPSTLNAIRKNEINRLIFANNNINIIRNKFDMLASKFKGNTDVIMISEIKLDDTFTVDQLVLEGFSKPYQNWLQQKCGWHLVLCSWKHTSKAYLYRKATLWKLFYWT